MYLGEFNSDELIYMLLGICVNSGKSNINNEVKDILKADIIEHMPRKLIVAYTKKELMSLLNKEKESGGEVILKEIIPNNYNIGIVRSCGTINTPIETLIKQIIKKYRYYAILTNSKIIVTFNSEICDLKTLKLKLAGNDKLQVTCTTIQVGTEHEDLKRDMQIFNVQETTSGKIVIYNINEKLIDEVN